VTFDEIFAKLDKSQLTMNHYKLISAAILGDMLEFFDYYIIGFILAFIVIPWKLSFAATAVVLLTAGLGSLFGAFFYGHLADRIGRRPVMILTVLTFSIPSGLMYFTPDGNWIMLSVLRFLVGVGVGGLYSVDLPLVQEFVPYRLRGFISGLVTSMIPIGALLGAASAAYLTPVIGWRGLFLLGMLPALLTLLIRAWVPESPRWLISKGRYEEAVKSINWVMKEKFDYKKIVVSAEEKIAATKKVSFMEIFQYPRSLSITWSVGFCHALIDYGFITWGPTLLALILQVPAARAAEMFVVITFFGFIARIFWSCISEALGRRIGGIMIGLGSAITLGIISQYYNAYWGDVPIIYPVFIATYFCVSGGWAITGPYSAEVWPSRLRSTGMGSSYGVAGIGRVFGPVILAIFAGSSNLVKPSATMDAIGPAYTFFACIGLVMAVIYFFGYETRKKSIDQIEEMLSAQKAQKLSSS